MSEQLIDKNVSIQYLPYPEEIEGKNMEAGKFLAENFTRMFEISYKVIGKDREGRDRVKYFTGLEPADFPEAEREEIQKVRDELEKEFGVGALDPFNEAFWKDKKLLITRKTTYLNMNLPEDKLKYYLIKGGGFKEVAASYDLAISQATPKRWYLIDASEYAEMDVEADRKLDRAIAALVDLEATKVGDEMFLIHKVLVTSDRGTTKKSPKALLYKDLRDFIIGKLVRTNKKQTAKQFLEVLDLLKRDKKKLYVGAYVKEGSYFNFLTVSSDNQIQNVETRTKYGSDIDKAVAYLTNPANQTELDNLKEKVENKWKQ